MKQLFLALQEALLLIEGIGDVDMWNNQVVNEELGETQHTVYPAVFVEFAGDVLYVNQLATVTVRLHCVVKTLGARNVLDVFDLRDSVVNTVVALGFGTKFDLVAERTDTDHAGLYDLQVDFATSYNATIPSVTSRYTVVPLTGWTVAGVLDIDNPVIRTGDGDLTT